MCKGRWGVMLAVRNKTSTATTTSSRQRQPHSLVVAVFDGRQVSNGVPHCDGAQGGAGAARVNGAVGHTAWQVDRQLRAPVVGAIDVAWCGCPRDGGNAAVAATGGKAGSEEDEYCMFGIALKKQSIHRQM